MSQHDRDLIRHARSALGEVPLEPGEMFFSRTDERGVILEGNDVFRRVSGFEWPELRGAPHKLVRHEDMPKGVFQLMWDRFKAGQTFVGYVKNKAKDGRHYWVLSLAYPIESGYLSVRIKPHSDLCDTVEGVYKKLRAAEQDDELTPALSAERLDEQIRQLGFKDYESFMSHALRKEIEGSAQMLHKALTPVQQRYFAMCDTIQSLGDEVEGLVEVIRAIRTVPMNMRILASRLENAGGPISAISVNYSQMLEEMTSWIKDFAEGPDCTFARIHHATLSGQFLVCAAHLQSNMSAQFEADIASANDQSALLEEREMLQRQAKAFQNEASEALSVIEAEVRRLSRSVLDMKRYVTGLSSTRMMCKIESASLGHSDTALNGIVEQLDQNQNEIERRLAQIIELNSTIQGHSSMLENMG